MTYRTITKSELVKVLKKHKLWLESNGEKGCRAVLSGYMLRETNLYDADLRYSQFSYSD